MPTKPLERAGAIDADEETTNLVEQKLAELGELMPGHTIVVMPPDFNQIIEPLAAQRNVTPEHYISQALGRVTGLHEHAGIWIGDLFKHAVTAHLIGELQARAKNARARERRPNGSASYGNFH